MEADSRQEQVVLQMSVLYDLVYIYIYVYKYIHTYMCTLLPEF